LTEQQQQQSPQLYQYSVKIDTTAKGVAVPTIHCYSNDMDTARKQAVEQYIKLLDSLEAGGITVAHTDHLHGDR
jgi:hypothetical protein